MKNKKCSNCTRNKPESDFRVRREATKKGFCIYLNNTCRKCDSLLSREYYLSHKNNIAFQRKTKQRSKQYIKNNRDVLNKKLKSKRESERGKLYRKNYDKINHDRILQLGRLRNKKYLKKIIGDIKDVYIVRLLKTEAYRGGQVIAGISFSKNKILEKKRLVALRRIQRFIKKIENEK